MYHLSKQVKLLWAIVVLTVATLACNSVIIHEPHPTPTAAWSILPLASGESTLYIGEEMEWSFDVPSSEVVLLSLEAHVVWPGLAGGDPVMEILVNDKTVPSELLVNKAITFTCADGRSFPYHRGAELESPPYWVLFYSPDYESNNTFGSNYQVLEGQACLYIFDITSLVEYGQTNKVVLINRGERVHDILDLDQPITIAFRQVKLIKKSTE